MKKIKIIFTLFVLSLISSCYSDKGNYEYHEINQVEISGLPSEEKIYYKNADVITVTPTITGTLSKDESNYQYKWVAIEYNPLNQALGASFELGTEKNLNYEVVLQNNRYKIFFSVLDTKTGVTWREGFPINVSSKTKEGWIVLQDKNGQTRLDLLSLPGGPANEELIHIKDLLQNSGMPYKKGPRSIKTIWEIYSAVNVQFVLMTDEGTTNLDPTSLEWDETLNYVYKFGASIDEITGYNAYSFTMGYSYFFFGDNDLYQRGGYVTDPLFIYPINLIDGKKVKVAPYLLGLVSKSSPAMILYDQTNKQFVQTVGGLAATGLTPCTIKETVFPNKTGKTLIYAANTYHDGGRGYTILKGDDAKSWLYAFVIKNSSSASQVANMYYEITAPNFNTAKLFAFHPQMPYLFYVAENKLYQFDLGTKDCKEVKTGLGAGEQITYLNFNHFVKLNGEKAPYRTLQDYLIVGSYNPAEPAESNGKLRMYEVDNNYNTDVKLAKTYDNLSKPIDVTYKEY